MLYLIWEPMIQQQVHKNKHVYRVHAGHDENEPTHSKGHLGNLSPFLPPTTNVKPSLVLRYGSPSQCSLAQDRLWNELPSWVVPMNPWECQSLLSDLHLAWQSRAQRWIWGSVSLPNPPTASTRSLSCSTADPNTKSPVTPVDLSLHSSFWWSW